MSDRGAEYRLDLEGADDDLQAELVQVAAVVIAWLESLAGEPSWHVGPAVSAPK